MQVLGGVEGGDTIIRIYEVRKRSILNKWKKLNHNQSNKNKPKHLSLQYIKIKCHLPPALKPGSLVSKQGSVGEFFFHPWDSAVFLDICDVVA